MKEFPQDPSVMIELLNRTAEEKAVQVAATADWAGLITQAMACNPAPLREVLREIGTTRTNLYPPVMLEFLGLMEEHKPKHRRPRKNDNNALREAARVWEQSYLKSTHKITMESFGAAKKLYEENDRHIDIVPLPYRIHIEIKEGAAEFPPSDEKPKDLALEAMANALFGSSGHALHKKIYKKKKGTPE